jgi:manganese/zinc/iron transport system permease protein
MIWTPLDTWIVTAAALAGAACALVGAFLVLEKISMMGDAISHGVLPGIAVAFIITGSRHGAPLFIGAAIVGILVSVLVHMVRRYGRLENGAAMGVVFTVLFAVGLILIERASRNVDIHPDHVLFGAVELVPLSLTAFGPFSVPRGVIVLAVVLLMDVAVVAVFFKELRLVTFDPGLATTLGINASWMHYLLMTLVALTTVAVFEVVGSILVIAMLIVPGAIAHLLTRRLLPFLIVSVVVAVAAALIGHVAAITVPPLFGFEDTSTSGSMATVLGLLFFTAFLLAPEQGIIARAWSRMRLRMTIASQDVLGLLARKIERTDGMDSGISFAELHAAHGSPSTQRRWRLQAALAVLLTRGFVHRAAGRYRLTDRGLAEATRVLQVHRLWERFFHDVGRADLGDLHPAADYLEHYTDPELQQALEQQLSGTTQDQSGRPMP